MKNTALVLLSGGQDSSTSLFWAKKKFKKVEAISFDYGQRHVIELKSAMKIAKLAGVKQTIIKIMEYETIRSSALINKKSKIDFEYDVKEGLPSTFVPGRNILFLTVAASLAYTKKIHNLVIGVSQVDYSGYPDCREGFIRSMERSLSLGMAYKIKIHTPLQHKTKKEVVLLAQKLGALKHMKHTHTCYRGAKKPCGTCPACKLRAKGFEDAGILDALYNN